MKHWLFYLIGFFIIFALGCWLAKWEADRWDRKHGGWPPQRLGEPEPDDRSSIESFKRESQR
jgi:hypothetical protein